MLYATQCLITCIPFLPAWMHKVISTVVHTFTIHIMHRRFKYVLVNGMMIPINNRTVEWNILRLTEIAGYGFPAQAHVSVCIKSLRRGCTCPPL